MYALKMSDRQCSFCQLTKPASEFATKTKCRTCRNEYMRAWRATKPPGQNNAAATSWRKSNPDSAAESSYRYRLRTQYGLTFDDYHRMLSQQGGRCAICKTDKPDRYNQRWFCVDHNHQTGRVRALLCGNCNDGLGRFREDVSFLKSAIEYLNAHADGDE